ncbi:hypothetical protein RD792_000224 [Penstemon davidsonii]|uniref:Uncharacterized protein n=1 Tax=Penstemon davidsonii TaxID=160366 RepID=A0ABR0DV12_9LAMI|nr:hypothetical protein RD792_000224 [Penstemon davidsonii]
MWPSRKLNNWSSSYFSISPSILVFLLLTPLLLISLLACNLIPQKSLSFEFLSSFSLNSLSQEHDSNLNAPESILLSGSLHQNLRKGEKLKNELSSAERRGFITTGLQRSYSISERKEAVLAKSRFSIREAAKNRSFISPNNGEDPNHYIPQGPIYRNANAFYQYYFYFPSFCPR